jgi:hypothetical protein
MNRGHAEGQWYRALQWFNSCWQALEEEAVSITCSRWRVPCPHDHHFIYPGTQEQHLRNVLHMAKRSGEPGMCGASMAMMCSVSGRRCRWSPSAAPWGATHEVPHLRPARLGLQINESSGNCWICWKEISAFCNRKLDSSRKSKKIFWSWKSWLQW